MNRKLLLRVNGGFGFLSSMETESIFRDGRAFSFLADDLAPKLFPSMLKVQKCTMGHGHIFNNKKVETRILTKSGLSLSPSFMVGHARTYQESSHEKLASELGYYVIMDNTEYPNVSIYLIDNKEEFFFSGRKNYRKAKAYLDSICGDLEERVIL